jgi:hypothetical protein
MAAVAGAPKLKKLKSDVGQNDPPPSPLQLLLEPCG